MQILLCQLWFQNSAEKLCSTWPDLSISHRTPDARWYHTSGGAEKLDWRADGVGVFVISECSHFLQHIFFVYILKNLWKAKWKKRNPGRAWRDRYRCCEPPFKSENKMHYRQRSKCVILYRWKKARYRLNWQEVLGKQLEIGMKDVDTSRVVIVYEPVWSIGPGKTPADKEYIRK